MVDKLMGVLLGLGMAICVLLLLLIGVAFVVSLFDDGPHPIVSGRLVRTGDGVAIVEWCDAHAKTSDWLIQTTVSAERNPDGTVSVWERSRRVGRC